MNDGQPAMIRDALVIGIAGFSLLTGMHFSPYFDGAFILVKALIAPGFFITSPLLLFYFTSLIVSAVTVMLAGVPAALFEHATGRKESDTVSLGIWLAGVLVLVIPVMLRSV